MEYGIRKYLTDRGYKDDEIDWDSNRKMVTLQGKDFMSATPRSDNLTYGTGDELGRALSGFQGVNQQSQNTNRQSQLNTLADQMMQRAQAPAPQFKQPDPFNYTPESDPQYQAALRTAQQNSFTAQNNTVAKLQSMGQGKSSYSDTLANQIAQRETGRVTDTVLPQLMQQAYGRWLDQANMGRQNQMDNYNVSRDQDNQLASIAQYLSSEDQRQFGNTMAQNESEQQAAQRRIGLAQWLTNTYGVNAVPKNDTGVAFDQVAGLTPIARQQFEEDKLRYGEDFALRRAMQKHNMTQDQARLDLSQQSYNDGKSSRQFSGTLIGDLGELTNEQDIIEFLNLNANEIVSKIGRDEYERIKASALAPFQNQRSQQTGDAKQQQAIRQSAINMAQKDDFWSGATPDEQKQMIDAYLELLMNQ